LERRRGIAAPFSFAQSSAVDKVARRIEAAETKK